MKTLEERFMESLLTPDPWRIYEKATGKLLCADYGALSVGDIRFDHRLVESIELRKTKSGMDYWHVVVH